MSEKISEFYPKIGKNAKNRPKMGKMTNFFFVKSYIYFAPFNPKNILCTTLNQKISFFWGGNYLKIMVKIQFTQCLLQHTKTFIKKYQVTNQVQ